MNNLWTSEVCSESSENEVHSMNKHSLNGKFKLFSFYSILMKKLLSVVIFLMIMPYYSFAQDSNSTIHEFGLNLSGPHTFGIRYRAGSESTLLRITLSSIEGSNQNSKATSNTSKFGSAGIAFNIGFEKRRALSDNFSLYIGSDLLTSYGSNTANYDNLSQKSDTWTLSEGLGLVLGFVYKINSVLDISAEVLPSVSYSYGKTTTSSNGVSTTQKNTGFNYGLGDTGANLTLSFRFGKKNRQ